MIALKDSLPVPHRQNVLITAKVFVLGKCYRPCVRWPPAAEILLQNQSAAVMVDVAGGHSVKSVRFQERDPLRNSVHLDLVTPQMEKILMNAESLQTHARMDSALILLGHIGVCARLDTPQASLEHPVWILMNVYKHQNPVISSVRTQRGATSVHVLEDTCCKQMGKVVKIWMNALQSSTIVSFFVSIQLVDLLVSALLDSHSIIQHVLITMNVSLKQICVDLKEYARILQAAFNVNANVDIYWINLAMAVKMLMNVREAIVANTAVRI